MPSSPQLSSLPTAQLCPDLAHHRLSFAPVRLIIGMRPRLTLAHLRPSPFSSTQHKLASVHHGTARLTPSLFALPRFTTAQLTICPASSPRLGSPHLNYSTAHTRPDCHKSFPLQDMHLSPSTRLLFSCTDHDFFGFS